MKKKHIYKVGDKVRIVKNVDGELFNKYIKQDSR